MVESYAFNLRKETLWKKEMYQIPDESLSKYMDIGLLSPFAVKNSVARLDMINFRIKHAVIPAINPERPFDWFYLHKGYITTFW